MNLWKDASECLVSKLNDKNLLEYSTKITVYRTRENDLFSLTQEHNLTFYLDIEVSWKKWDSNNIMPIIDVYLLTGPAYFKIVLLHNGNKFGSVQIAHSTVMKGEYETIVLQSIKYQEHRWMICMDLKKGTLLTK